MSFVVDGLPRCRCFVADNACVPNEHVLTPFNKAESRGCQTRDIFNFHLSQCRIRIEMAFGRMAGKWKILKKHQRKGRELDPRYFNQHEEKAFAVVGATEWKSLLDTGVVTVIPLEKARKVNPSRIFRRPPRNGLTDKSQEQVSWMQNHV